MPIIPGLARIDKLLQLLHLPLTFRTIHVSGTNGKGSIVSYLSSILSTSLIPTGRFTSPYLRYRWDSIAINNKSIDEDVFLKWEDKVNGINKEFKIGASEFEVMTAIAFGVFQEQNVEIAIVECGLGGLLDSTNILTGAKDTDKGGVICSVISKIGLDHEGFLGSTLPEIATHKAGIIKYKIPIVVDGSNNAGVLDTITRRANQMEAPITITSPSLKREDILETRFGSISLDSTPLPGSFQASNLSCALTALESVHKYFPSALSKVSRESVLQGIRSVVWEGRLQHLTLERDGKKVTFLLDGAHNGSAAIELGKYVDENIRANGKGVHYVMAFTQGKDLGSILPPLLTTEDRVTVTQFGDIDGMPWIRPQRPEAVAEQMKPFTPNVSVDHNPLSAVFSCVNEDNAVVCGSLYLASLLLRSCM